MRGALDPGDLSFQPMGVAMKFWSMDFNDQHKTLVDNGVYIAHDVQDIAAACEVVRSTIYIRVCS